MYFVAKGLTTALAVALGMSRSPNPAAILVALSAIWIGAHDLQESTAAQPRTARGRSAQRTPQAQQFASIHWDRVPLRDAVERISALFGESVFIDRRVDPNQRVSLQLEAKSIDEVLQSIAGTRSLGVSRLGKMHYLGPRQSTAQLRTVAVVRGDEIARFSQAERDALLKRQRLTWPRLTEPRILVISLVEERGLEVLHADRIPHDLWAAGQVPELSVVELLTVLLTGFELTFRLEHAGRAVEIVPLETVAIQRRYPVPGQLPDAQAFLRQELPTAVTRIKGRTMVIDGRVEDHERLAELLTRPSAPQRSQRPTSGSVRVYTLRVQEQPVGSILRQLAERTGWTVEFDESSIHSAGLSLDARVSFSVENSSPEDLLDAVLAPAGLDYRREGERLIIVPRDR